MKKKIIYIANDGTEFENKKECEHYENRYIALLDNPEVMFFNKGLEPLTKCNIMGDHFWHNLFACSYYINIPSVECFDLLEEVYDEILVDRFTDFDVTDNNKIGLWRYNESREYWENLIEIKAKTDKIIEQANEIVLKEKKSYGNKENI